tara:strand:- start:3865 stop:4401 length:537 start_codon:yes stop_codon:yes gene_type:complete
MKFYETTYIVHSGIQDGRLDDIVKKVESKLKSIKGELLFSDNWGRKKLAYYINKQKYGTYLFFQFKISDNKSLPEIVQEFELNPDILRHLIIQIDENDIKESSEEQEKTNIEKAMKNDTQDSKEEKPKTDSVSEDKKEVAETQNAEEKSTKNEDENDSPIVSDKEEDNKEELTDKEEE